jgi:hypothetical protein
MLILADMMAGMLISQARMALALDQMNTTGVPAGSGFNAYQRRFGNPVAVGARFRNRFDGSMHNTLPLAQASEMNSLSARLARVEHLLGQDLHYRCTSAGTSIRVGNCSYDCHNNDALESCSTGDRNIIICPPFWDLLPEQQGLGIIHEGFHIVFGLDDHDTKPYAQSFAQRRAEPECYTSFVADVNGVTPFDPSCPII